VHKVSSKIIGIQQTKLSELYNRHVLKKAESIMSDSSHPLYVEFKLLPSGSRFSQPPAKTNRFKFSFVPSAISLLNSVKNR